MKMMIQRFVLGIAALGCAEGAQRPGQEITPRTMPDQGVSTHDGMPADQTVSDAQLPDAEVQHAERSIWVVVGDEGFEDGPRYRLTPPQTPEFSSRIEILDTLPFTVPVVTWRGPATAGDDLVRSSLEAGRMSVPLFMMPPDLIVEESTEQIQLELRYLEGTVFQQQSALSRGGVPLLALRWRAEESEMLAQVASLAANLDFRPRLILLDAPGDDGLGDELDVVRVPPCLRQDPIRAPLIGTVVCVAGSHLPQDEALFGRMLIEGRRSTDAAQGILVVDGIARWVDDRQIDPISLQDSVVEVGDVMRVIPSYGSRRLQAVQRLSVPATRTALLDDLLSDPYLVAPGWTVAIERENDGRFRLDGELGEGEGLGIILNEAPWLAPSNTAISYRRGGAGTYLRVSDAQGRVTAPPPAGEMQVCLPLSIDGKTRLEELEIARVPGTTDARFRFTGVEFVSSDSEQCRQLFDRDDLPP